MGGSEFRVNNCNVKCRTGFAKFSEAAVIGTGRIEYLDARGYFRLVQIWLLILM